MTRIARIVVLVAACAGASCGGTTSTIGDTGGDTASDLADAPADGLADLPEDTGADPDAADVLPPDLPPDCARWHLVSPPVTSLYLADPSPINTERTFRVTVGAEMSGCMRRAMPQVQIDEASLTATVTLRAWNVSGGVDCPTVIWSDIRYVTLRLPTVGLWSVVDGTGSVMEPAEVEVGPGPPRPCGGASGDCEMDCDCPHDMSVCLGGWGLGGPFTACAHPCEDDMDCFMGGGRCLSMDDGLDLTCHPEVDQCSDSSPCPDGYLCEEGWCAAGFTLGTAQRASCTCDDDCTPPLACTVASPGDPTGRCEVLCPTSSPRWCEGPHFCAEAYQDISGLALTDSVCGWVGD